MRIVIFGLAVSSSWGNGHAALWRGLIRALHTAGHRVTFFERDVPYYAEHRDLVELPGGGELVLYKTWDPERAQRAADNADVAMVTSYCPDACAATRLIMDSRAPLRCFYDLDTSVTLARLAAGEPVDYMPSEGLGRFDLVFSYTGGGALDALQTQLGARRVMPLYGSVDSVHIIPVRQYRSIGLHCHTSGPMPRTASQRFGSCFWSRHAVGIAAVSFSRGQCIHRTFHGRTIFTSSSICPRRNTQPFTHHRS